ncbi:MAG: GTPase family protein [Granulosicoccus sp.]
MQSKSIVRRFLKSQKAAVWYLSLVVVLPLVTLVALGLVMLWQNDWLIFVSAAWLLVTLAGYGIYRLWPEALSDQITAPTSEAISKLQDTTRTLTTPDPVTRDDELEKTNLPVRLDKRDDWTELDNRVWLRAVESVELTLKNQPTWEELPELSLATLTAVSGFYNIENKLLNDRITGESAYPANRTYSFTLPEVLLVLSITSSRYRQLVLEYIPFADKVKVSSLLNLYARQDQIKTGAKWINTIRRTTRFVNPLAAVTAELRDQFTNRIFTNLSDKVQNDLKRLLLQELVQVGMDLYSGRLKSSMDELADYRSHHYSQDTNNLAVPVEPIRVVLAGQVSSGKSSLINALISNLEAETDILPTTDRQTVHSLHWPDDSTDMLDDADSSTALHLIDTTGLDDKLDNLDSLVGLAQQADLLIWVARANQPARAPDLALHQALQDALRNQPMRRPAPVLLVITHVDQLKPKAVWQPPYDLRSDNAKAVSIRQAVESCVQQIGLPGATPVVPVCLAATHELYNVDLVAAQIMLLQSEATQTQFNRRRTEHDDNSTSWRDRWNQASRLGTVSGKVLIRSILGG